MSDPQALHAELLGDVEIQRDRLPSWYRLEGVPLTDALRAVVELHQPYESRHWGICCRCCCNPEDDNPGFGPYPCDTIEVISSALGVTTDG